MIFRLEKSEIVFLAPATFQRCMSMFLDLVKEAMEIFMDDFSVYGSNFENYLKNLEIVL